VTDLICPGAGGDCYQAAIRCAEDLRGSAADVEVVHADVMGQGPIDGVVHGHAWVELDRKVVFDRSNGRRLIAHAEQYHAAGQAENVRRYTLEEARRLMVETGHFGPWEKESC
jgi:hypothetical protein